MQLITLGDCTRISAIVARAIIQGPNHERNLQIIIKLILQVLDVEFSEDNAPTLKAFFLDAFDHAYTEVYPYTAEAEKTDP